MNTTSWCILFVFVASLAACVLLEIFTKAGAGWVWLLPFLALPGFHHKD